MITSDEQLHQTQTNIQIMWRFLEAARKTHSPLDYQRLAVPYLLQLQERQKAVTGEYNGNISVPGLPLSQQR